MILSPAHIEHLHRATQAAHPVASTMTMRTCTGECRRQRSIGQYAAGSTVCIRCKRRAP